MIQNKNSMNRSIRSEMSNRVPSWFAQSAAACVLSGESLFGSAQRSGPPTHPSESRTQSAQRDGWTDLANRLRLVTSEEALDGKQDGADHRLALASFLAPAASTYARSCSRRAPGQAGHGGSFRGSTCCARSWSDAAGVQVGAMRMPARRCSSAEVATVLLELRPGEKKEEGPREKRE